jgi:hypothetical protein
VHIKNIRPRAPLPAVGAAALTPAFVAVSTVPASAAPVSYGTGDVVTFSDTTLDPGQSFTITEDTLLPYAADGSFGGVFALGDTANWVFDSCTVTTGPGTCGSLACGGTANHSEVTPAGSRHVVFRCVPRGRPASGRDFRGGKR